jgi:hypothetical protein
MTAQQNDCVLKFPCFIVLAEPLNDGRVADPIVNERSNFVVLHCQETGQALFPVFTNRTYVRHFAQTVKTGPTSCIAVRIETAERLCEVLKLVVMRAGVSVDLLIDASDSFPGWEIPHQAAIEGLSQSAVAQ